MKNQSIYLGLKIKDNALQFQGENIFKFNPDNNILTEYKINETIAKLKRYLDDAMKMYIKTSYAYQITIDKNLISLKLWCNQDNDKFTRKIDFISFFDNEITYL